MTIPTIYHARHQAHLLNKLRASYNRYLPTLASANIDLHPHQIAAAMFASDKDVIIADEEGLGKTITAGIVLLDSILSDKNKLLVLAPKNLLSHWKRDLNDKFGIEIVSLDSSDTGVVLLSYQQAVKQADKIAAIEWDLCVLDEAHVLANANLDDKTQSDVIHKALQNRRKLLLTATPMQNSLLDLYYLVRLIDDKTFGGTPESFKKKYIENKNLRYELAARAQQICWRTLKRQALTMQLPKRQVRTILVQPTDAETELSKKMSLYFHRDTSVAFPKIREQEPYLRLTFWKLLASGTRTLSVSLAKVMDRLDAGEERDELQVVKDMADGITTTARMGVFLKTVKESFAKLRAAGAPKKILVFSENKTTLAELYERLTAVGYRVILSSSNTAERDIETFRGKVDILLAGDHLGKGLDLSFCSCVINYDVPWNVQTLEQRISRCHRYGQKHDVLVVNFIDPTNRADRRLYTLLNKKLKQFDEVFGASETVLGELVTDKMDIDLRTENEIKESAKLFESENKEIINSQVIQAESDLLAHFDNDVAAKFKFYAQHLPDMVHQTDEILWNITKYILQNKIGITIRDEIREISMSKMRYNGVQLSGLYFRMSPDARRGERYCYSSPLARQVVSECTSGRLAYGSLLLKASDDFPSGTRGAIGFWNGSATHWVKYKSFSMSCGYKHSRDDMENLTELTESECDALMQLPVISWSGGHFDEEIDGSKKLDSDLEKIRDKIFAVKSEKALIESDEEAQSEIRKIELWIRDEIEALELSNPEPVKETAILKTARDSVSSFAERFRLNKKLAGLEKQKQSTADDKQKKIAEINNKKAELIRRIKSRPGAEYSPHEDFIVTFEVE